MGNETRQFRIFCLDNQHFPCFQFLGKKHLDISGSSMVELALTIPVLALFLFGIVQYGFIFSAYVTLQNAAGVAARFATLSDPKPTEAEVAAVARDAILPMLPVAQLRVPQIELNQVVGGVGGARRVELTYDLEVFFPFVVPQAQNGVFPLTTSVIMR